MVDGVYLADGAKVVGDVVLEEGANIWYNAVIRADHGKVHIGKGTNIQDNCVIHTKTGRNLEIGSNVTVGHGAILHGEYIGDNTLIGMGSILLNGTKVGKSCIIGAGSLLTQDTEIPDFSLAFGSPARVIRSLTKEEKAANTLSAEEYVRLAKEEL